MAIVWEKTFPNGAKVQIDDSLLAKDQEAAWKKFEDTAIRIYYECMERESQQ